MKVFEINKLYDLSDDFFKLNGSAVMKLTTSAAQEVCRQAFEHGFVVARIEGGIWYNPGFEARLDCIWDGIDPPATNIIVIENNKKASKMIRDENIKHNAFIITTAPLTGWPHRQK